MQCYTVITMEGSSLTARVQILYYLLAEGLWTGHLSTRGDWLLGPADLVTSLSWFSVVLLLWQQQGPLAEAWWSATSSAQGPLSPSPRRFPGSCLELLPTGVLPSGHLRNVWTSVLDPSFVEHCLLVLPSSSPWAREVLGVTRLTEVLLVPKWSL